MWSSPGLTRDGGKRGRHRGRLQLCTLGPTVVLAGSREGLPGMVAPSLGAEAAGQWAQRTAHVEAINTDRPGMPLQAGRPRWDGVRLGHWLCLPRALCWGRGLWVWVLPAGTDKAEA